MASVGSMVNAILGNAKVSGKYRTAIVLTLVFESLFLLWFQSGSSSYERIAAGLLATLVLIVFLFRMSPSVGVATARRGAADQLIGKWDFVSTPQSGPKGKGSMTIARDGGELRIEGTLSEGHETIGPFHSELAGVKDTRLIFYYILRDKTIGSVDAISIL